MFFFVLVVLVLFLLVRFIVASLNLNQVPEETRVANARQCTERFPFTSCHLAIQRSCDGDLHQPGQFNAYCMVPPPGFSSQVG